jgi:hypothetical protein|tara:strand:+ start:194 stop:457 length:264 start_codon:yes stop_codon:yes gene_type:complete
MIPLNDKQSFNRQASRSIRDDRFNNSLDEQNLDSNPEEVILNDDPTDEGDPTVEGGTMLTSLNNPLARNNRQRPLGRGMTDPNSMSY